MNNIEIQREVASVNNRSEDEVENEFLRFVQRIVNEYFQRNNEYIKFVRSETVNVDELVLALNRVRWIYKLYSLSTSIIEKYSIVCDSSDFVTFTNESLLNQLNELDSNINELLKKIQRVYNDSFDIDDEEEYQRIQNEQREKRKKFRLLNELCKSYYEAIDSFVPISVNIAFSGTLASENKVEESNSEVLAASEITENDNKQITEQSFFNWLVSDGGVAETTARQYISNIHSIEKLYQTLFGVRKNLLGADSGSYAQEMIETLVHNSEYIDANERRHNSFSAALSKFAQFADLSIDGIKTQSERKNVQVPIISKPYVVKNVDFSNPQDCTYYKPCFLTIKGQKYPVGKWKEVYTKLLTFLYADNTYSEKLKGKIGKSLYGRCIDFADKNYLHYLRKPIKVSSNFFAEGNLSAAGIIKRIKCLMDLCSVDSDIIQIEYNTQVQSDESDDEIEAFAENAEGEQFSIFEDDSEITDTSNITENVNDEVQINSPESSEVPESQETIIDSASFEPDLSIPFVLKEAVIAILSSNDAEINKRKEYKSGMSSKVLRELIKEYYGKSTGMFEISKLLMMDKTFRSVGKGCYALNENFFLKDDVIVKQDAVEQKTEDNSSSVRDTPEDIFPEKIDSLDERNESNPHITDESLAEKIVELIKNNKEGLQYRDGFSAYDVKMLLAGQGIINQSEEYLEELMSECEYLKEVEEGYYVYIDEPQDKIVCDENRHSDITPDPQSDVFNTTPKEGSIEEIVSSDTRRIILNINGKMVRAYDYSDALCKICEFAINFKPFRMARIAGQGIRVNGSNVFYRKAVPVDGYNKLSNGLQLIRVVDMSDLLLIADEVKKYCQIADDTVKVISR